METKHLIALPLLIAAAVVGMAASGFSRRVREAVFFLLVAGAVLVELMDVNFFTHFWYRGTTRGLEISLSDILALSLLAGVCFGRAPANGRRTFWPIGLAPLLIYFLYAAFSVVVSEPHIFGFFELTKILRGLLVFLAVAFFVRGPRELTLLVLGLGCAVGLEGLLAFKQHMLGGVYRAQGTLDHPNSLSMYLCLTGPVLVAAAAAKLPGWVRGFSGVALLAAAIAVLFTVSRAGVPVFFFVTLAATAACVSWRVTPRKLAVAGVIVLAGAILVKSSWTTLKARYGEATLATEYLDPNSEGRGYYLRMASAILQDRALGVGLNNWSYWVSKSYGNRLGYMYEDYDDLYFTPSKEILSSIHYAAPAHSLAALTAGELGIPGLVLFTVLWIRWMAAGVTFLPGNSTDPMRQLGVGCFFGLLGMLMQSTTEWTFRQTPIFFTSHVLLGVLAALYYQRRLKRLGGVVQPVNLARGD